MEAPEKCYACPLGQLVSTSCKKRVNLDGELPVAYNHRDTITPGPECPFVLLAAKDAEIERIGRALLDPLTVLANILRGTIAKPSGYERIDPQVIDAARDDKYSDEYVGNVFRAALKGE